MEIFSTLLSLSAASILLVAYVLYLRKTSSGDAKPNVVSWGLWVLLIALNTITYGFMTGDVVKTFTTIASSTAVVFIFINALREGAVQRLDWWDIGALSIGLIATFVWWKFHSATYGNLVLQIAFVLSALPTLRNVITKPANEPALPWLLWGAAFLLNIIVVLLRWEDQVQDLIYPTNALFWHTLFGVLALRKQ